MATQKHTAPSDLCTAQAIATAFGMHPSAVYRAWERGDLEAWALVDGGAKARPIFRMVVARRWAADHAAKISSSGKVAANAARRIRRRVGGK